jgi:hypothetical protein
VLLAIPFWDPCHGTPPDALFGAIADSWMQLCEVHNATLVWDKAPTISVFKHFKRKKKTVSVSVLFRQPAKQ